MGHQYVYNPAPALPRQQVALNPWDDPQPAHEQVTATIDTGHQYIYNPAPVPTQQRAASNPWDDLQPAQEQAAANHVPFHMGHQYVYNPAPALPPQQVAPNPWDDPQPASAAFNPWTTAISHVAYPAFCAVYPLHLPSPAAMHYPGHTGVQFYSTAPAPEPNDLRVYQGKPAHEPAHVSAHYGGGGGNPTPLRMVPRNLSPNDQFYCRELDSSYALRTGTAIMRDCQPGYWDYGSSGYPYWVRTT